MMKAELKAGYDAEKDAVTGRAAVTFKAGDFKFSAMTDATVINCPSLDGLTLSVEKPDSFTFKYDVKKDLTFQFMNSFKVLEKSLNLKYIHKWRIDETPLDGNCIHSNEKNEKNEKNETTLDGTLVFDSANKLSANHKLGSGGCKLKYSYVHGGLTTLEPSYDTEEKSFDFAASRKVYGDDVCKATYHTKINDLKSSNLGLEWSRSSALGGSFKVGASLCLDDAEYIKLSKLTAETSWDFEI